MVYMIGGLALMIVATFTRIYSSCGFKDLVRTTFFCDLAINNIRI